MPVDEVLSRTDHVLLAFDGPVCTGLTGAGMAERLRILLHDATLPAVVARTANPLTVLGHARTYGPGTARALHTQLRALEYAAVATATVTPGAREALAALLSAGTVVTVVSGLATEAVRNFLVLHDLSESVKQICARQGPDTDLLPPNPFLVEAAVRHRGVPAEYCTFVGTNRADRKAARAAGVRVVTYAPTRRRTARTIPSMTDLIQPVPDHTRL